MSQANAAARKRRAGGATLQDNVASAQTNNNLPQAPKGGLTLPQVISLVDKRLITLETFMKETQNNEKQSNEKQSNGTQNNETKTSSASASEDAVNQLADEFDSKFSMLAQELAELKDVVLKLQTYTMEVNKTLYEERINVLSDMGQLKDDKIDFYISEEEIEEPPK